VEGAESVTQNLADEQLDHELIAVGLAVNPVTVCSHPLSLLLQTWPVKLSLGPTDSGSTGNSAALMLEGAYFWHMVLGYVPLGTSVVFVGTGAGGMLALRCHCHPGRINRFRELLWRAGSTGDRILVPEQVGRVLSFGDFDVPAFRSEIEQYQPHCVAFNGATPDGVVARFLR